MKLGLHLNRWDWAGGPERLAATLGDIARLADDVGYASLSVMDHFFQIPRNGALDDPMLEAYTTLGFIAARTSRIQIGTVVSGVTYRHPGILVKQVTTLDVLSGGRAYLGIGAAFFEVEHRGLGIPFPPDRERLARLEETLEIAHRMWSGRAEPYQGTYYSLEQPLNVPAPVRRPRPPILIGGGGERRTLQLVARYADACNLFPESRELLVRKLDVLRDHCEREGRDYAEIEKTVQYQVDLGAGGERVNQVVDELGALAELGFTRAIGGLRDVDTLRPIEIIGRDVIQRVAAPGQGSHG